MTKTQFRMLAGIGLILFLLVFLMLVPTPKLITYERSNVVSKGVYWRGFGESGMLLDANASFVKIDPSTQYLHVCYEFEKGDSCQQYRVIETQGLLAVIRHLL
ncbi:hypothetical protein [Bowmanella dokdonensis]|uniref:Uncharacterized protein n=1 Tax=Bowmanella dokdonensis TaxID=751969 RepID=A0A939IQM2_9ALTE|nr:hypothetical protein [Bowmanella dokdonensis]MBN7827085.1 hypothetical protein [Bowmanella dokdonensis]